jgi:hypothetical protein
MEKSNFFKKHLDETGESYFEHLLFTFMMSLWLLLTSVILLLHSIFPFILAFNTSKHVSKINQVMQKRSGKLLERRIKKKS